MAKIEGCKLTKARNRAAFTLVELLVVIAIIALLLSVLMPALSNARKSARAAICMAGIKQVSVLVSTYMEDNRGSLPVTAPSGYWPSVVAKQVEKIKGYDTAKWQYCPERPKKHKWAAIYGMNVLLGSDPPLKIIQIPQAPRTILLSDTIEKSERYTIEPKKTDLVNDWCYKLRSADLDKWIHGSPPWFRHKGKANILFVDGHLESRRKTEVSISSANVMWSPYYR